MLKLCEQIKTKKTKKTQAATQTQKVLFVKSLLRYMYADLG